MKRRILVIDDDPIFIKVACQVLEEAGYSVSAASNGERGLDLVREQCPDLVLLDVLMPGMDGFQVCHKIKTDPAYAQVRVLLSTGIFGSPAEIQAAAVDSAHQPDGYLTKPIGMVALLQEVQRLLGEGRPLKAAATALPRVLVVDDDPQSLSAIGTPTDEWGFQIAQVPDVARALESIAAWRPDVVLVAETLPPSGGLTQVPRLRELDLDLPVMLIVSVGQEIGMAGMDGFATRPLTRWALVQALQTLRPIRDLRKQNRELARHLRESGLRLMEKQRELGREHEALQSAYSKLQDLDNTRETLYEMVAHDLRNPLSVIIGALELVQEDLRASVSPSLKDVLHSADQAAHQMMTLLENLLGVQRLEEGKMPIQHSEVDLLDLLQTALRLARPMAAEKHLQLVEQLPEVLSLVQADANILLRVVMNLLDNAIKFTPRGGTITISALAKDGKVQVSVIDTGIGIALEYHQRIFERFEQVRSSGKPIGSGVGLGLAFCKLAVEGHGGKIWVESKEGAGSRFLFTLPIDIEQTP